MEEYTFKVTETSTTEVTVTASSPEEALERAEEKFFSEYQEFEVENTEFEEI